MMQVITAEDIDRALTYPALIEALREAFRADITVPVRHHHPVPQAGADAMLLLMPAWTSGEGSFLGCKIVTVFPDNGKLGKPAVLGSYMLMSGTTGEPLATMDGTILTRWRTAAASALASSYLSREDAAHLVMVGAGALAPHLVRAHASVRPIKKRHVVEPHARARRAARRSGWRSAASKSRSPTISKRRCARPTSSPARRSRPSRWCAASGSRRARISISSAASRRRCARPTTTR